MRIKYDKSVDAAYIELGDTRAPGRLKTREVGNGIALDFDSEKRLVGIEVLDASHHLHAELLAAGTPGMTLAQAQKHTGLASVTLRAQIQRGRIKAEKKGRDWIVDRSELDRYMESRDGRGRPAASRKARRLKRPA